MTDTHDGPTNRLAGEISPYLLQHAYNPVHWHAWGEEAFELARKQNKPIFLSIGYSTCYWCHVMEKEFFEKTDVARILNEHFLAVKVDREERPDIDGVRPRRCLSDRQFELLTGSVVGNGYRVFSHQTSLQPLCCPASLCRLAYPRLNI